MKFWMWRGQFLLPWCPFDKMTATTNWGGSGVSCQRLWQRWWWIFQYSGMWCRVEWYIGTSVSEEHAAVIIRTLNRKMETKRSSETFVAVSYPRRWIVKVLLPPHQVLVPSEIGRWSAYHSLVTATSVSLCTSRLRLQIRSGEGACKIKVTQRHECICGWIWSFETSSRWNWMPITFQPV
jgi:hypothetical protein